MFNRGGFNTLPFNREGVEGADKYASMIAEISSETSLHAAVEYTGQMSVDVESEAVLVAIREQYGAASVKAISETNLHISTRLQITIEATSESVLKGRRMHTQMLQFTGQIRPGEQLMIDTERMTATLNGQNVLNKINGLFVELQPGQNTITYADTDNARNIDLILRHRGRSY
ncbi:phage tail family protein [Aneurinibacillus aneurinilyticus]|uniref:phage distal tail protein n=1 Tax=Aneurinibacillus aneurinilyticus TaxID=1391 RepID=UPI002E1A3065|nr:phage tail family protein [Aneurinibacillus aneurinilyticus]